MNRFVVYICYWKKS